MNRPIARVLEPKTLDPSLSTNAGTAAIVICHGMGQQVKWETLSELVATLDAANLLDSSMEPGVRQVQVKEDQSTFFLGRTEFVLRERAGETIPYQAKAVHMYEVYWAPLTEGKITLRQTVTFLLQAGRNGVIQTFRNFYRYGQFTQPATDGDTPPALYKSFRAGAPVLLAFVVTLLVVFSLIVINASITFGALKELISSTDIKQPEDRELLRSLTADLWLLELGVLMYLMAIAGSFAYRTVARKRRPQAITPLTLQLGLWGITSAVLGLLVVIGLGVIPWHYLAYVASAPIQPGSAIAGTMAEATQGRMLALLRLFPSPISLLDPLYVHAALVWGLIVIVSYKVRELLVQFVGDVAIYVSHHVASSFDETRDAIKALARQAVCAVIEKGGYERVIVVGHSLGSVIAYDALNSGLLVDDLRRHHGPYEHEFRYNQPAPKSRPPDTPFNTVRRLITFGSPLDKTAFVFRSADSGNAAVREGLAVTVQPLILAPASRGFDWVNIHSRNDIISGALDYYPRVTNVEDPQADIPIWAHTQFWSNQLLAQTLADACVDSFEPRFRPDGYEVAHTVART